MNEFTKKGVYSYLRQDRQLCADEIFVEAHDTTRFICRLMLYLMVLLIVGCIGTSVFLLFFTQPPPNGLTVLFLIGALVALAHAIAFVKIPRQPAHLLSTDGQIILSIRRLGQKHLADCYPSVIVSEPKVRRISRWTIKNSTSIESVVWLRVQLQNGKERYILLETCLSPTDADELAVEWAAKLDCPAHTADEFDDVPTHVVRVG